MTTIKNFSKFDADDAVGWKLRHEANRLARVYGSQRIAAILEWSWLIPTAVKQSQYENAQHTPDAALHDWSDFIATPRPDRPAANGAVE